MAAHVSADSPTPIAFSPDGKILVLAGDDLALAGADPTVRLFDPATGKDVRQLGGSLDHISALAFSPNGKILALGTGTGTVRLWDAATWTEIDPRGPQAGVRGVSFSPDGRVLATKEGERTGELRLWDAATGKPLQQFPASLPGVLCSAFSPDGKTLALGSADKTIRFRDMATAKELWQIATEQHIKSIAFSPDGKTLASGESDEDSGKQTAICLREPATGKVLQQFPGHKTVHSLTFSADGKVLSSGGSTHIYYGHPGSDEVIRLWDAATGKELQLVGHQQKVRTVAFSPDSKVLASGSDDKTIRLWEVASGKERCQLGEGGDCCVSVAFSPNGKLLVSAHDSRKVRLWDVATGKKINEVVGHNDVVWSVCFAPDGKTFATGSKDTTVLLWDVTELSKGQPIIDSQALLVEQVWAELASTDAGKSHRAMIALMRTPQETVAWLAKNLRPTSGVDPKELARLIGDLENNDFGARERATKELERLGEVAELALKNALADKPSLETRRRLTGLLDTVAKRELSADQLRALRAVEVLERLGTPDARQVLQVLAQGAAGARQTREAQAALDRLAKLERGQ
ncbi:hypothetical protein AYO44_16275 [Planctomycetaceae bacterium SCGC AG-212-F19]|nr:hypothetical protein AYO44_16275 [Planctomycetaceae bacterium SCGC AG-212-F19]